MERVGDISIFCGSRFPECLELETLIPQSHHRVQLRPENRETTHAARIVIINFFIRFRREKNPPSATASAIAYIITASAATGTIA